ncbi:DUF6680 family protein [Chromobacterium vaccinii]|uniref:DUF6680 family protein n=1 Tax=Chromobacterium vaccinii TaxID=1108595 RepID=UPI0032605090
MSDYWMLIATLAGPVLAVQAQKWIERAKEQANRRDWVFTTLMATRQARVSIDHVRALNSIDLAFYGKRIPILGTGRRSTEDQAVLDAWHEYHAHLCCLAPNVRPIDETGHIAWTARGDELFTNLLECIAKATNYKFERTLLRAGSYTPEAHGTIELQQQAIRSFAVEVALGNRSLPMEVKSWPVDQELGRRQITVQEQLVEGQRETLSRLVDILNRLESRTGNRDVPPEVDKDVDPLVP